MGLYFGTDGLRGIVNEDLSFEIAYKVGNALSTVKSSPTVLIGRDTRVSGEYLTLAVAGGVMSGGGSVIDLGVIPTAGVAYLVRNMRADYGVVISASHNSAEYNGIKVFDSSGYKLGDKEEERLERCFIHSKINDFPDVGRFRTEDNLYKRYEDFLVGAAKNSLSGLSVVLDCANGAACRIAPAVFRKLGASVVASCASDDGMRINDGCGALYPETLVRRMARYKADVGFAFDGDADRLMVVTREGKIIDGDMSVYMIARHLHSEGKLRSNTVVGTSHTNMAIERALADHGIGFVRTDIGDKYVLARMLEKGLSLGGEQSGHIILGDLHTTGDGILSAITIADMIVSTGKELSELADVRLYPQVNINVVVEDKFKIMNSERLSREVAGVSARLADRGRVMVRASGTEPKIRIMVESEDEEQNRADATLIASCVRQVDAEI